MDHGGSVGFSWGYGSFLRRGSVAGWIAACLLAALLGHGAIGHAQTPAGATREEARTLFMRGQGSYNVGNYEDAIRDWGAAYAIDPRPLIQYNLSQAYERLGRLVEAIAALDRFIAEAQPGDPMYAEANARLAALRQRLSLTGVRIVGGPDGGRITVDGRDWGVTPRPDRIAVEPGQHTITITYPNGTTFNSQVAVPAGMVIDVTAGEQTLQQQEEQVVSAPTSDPGWVVGPGEPVDRGASPGLPLIIAGGATAGVGVGVFIYGILRQTSLSGCDDPGFVCVNESTVERQRTAGMVTGALLMAGGGALMTIGFIQRGRSDDGVASVECGVGLGSASCRMEF